MGEIKKQGISNSIIIILGAIIGAFNVMFLFPNILPDEYFGLTRVLVEVTYIILQFGLLGGSSAIIRFWSKVDKGKYLFKYVLKHSLLFSLLVVLFISLFKNQIIDFYLDKSPLISEHYNTIYVLFISTLLFEIFSATSVAMLKTQVPIFLKEVFIRVYVTFIILIYYYKLIEEFTFINLFVLGYVLIGIIIAFYVLKNKKLLKPSITTLPLEIKKEVFKFRLASFFNGLSSGIVNRLDILMIAALVNNGLIESNGLRSVAIYSIALYTSTLIEIPSRGIFTISSPMISTFWTSNDLKSISSVYKKSSISLLIIALLLFLLLSLNLDHLLSFLKDSFIAAKPVILILGISKVFNMLLGVNNIILSTSKHYIIGSYTMMGLIILTFSLNYWLIPLYGINGAAAGSFVSLVVYNLVSFFFLWYKFKLQPFSINTLKVFLIGGLAYYITNFIIIENIYFSIVMKTIVFSTLYLLPVYFFKISLDINEVVNKTLNRFSKG